MSWQAVQWAMRDAPMLYTAAGKPDTTARFVLVAHAERASEYGRDSYAATADRMKYTGFDERTIQRAEERLERAGLLIRDGLSHLGTARYHLAMSVKAAVDEDQAVTARIDRRRKADAARQRRRRASQKADADAIPGVDVTDAESVTSRTQNPDVTDGGSVTSRTQRPPNHPVEPPLEPPDEPPTGGTLPPDPLRPQDPPSSDLGNGIESSLSIGGDQPPQPGSATTDRARERHLAVVPDPPVQRGHGFCLTCHAAGQTTLAVDPVHGAACAIHLQTA